MRSMVIAGAVCVSAGLCASAQGQWLTNGSNIFYSAGNVGVGTGNPGARVHAVTNLSANGSRSIFGHANAATGVTYGVYGLANSTQGRGVFGWATAASGGTFGVMGQVNSVSGRGVVGLSVATSGVAHGVYGESRGTTAVVLPTPANTPAGIFGFAPATTGRAAGVVGHVQSPRGTGVAGFSMATSGESSGVYGESSSTVGRGVFGVNLATTGVSYGVYGEARSTTNVLIATPANTPAGVLGSAPATTGRAAGVVGHAQSPTGAGVAGFSTAASGASTGVYGEANSPVGLGVAGYALATSGSATGVYGTSASAAQGWGVYSEGALGATEKLFQIDHPLDPANKFLNHFCTEGPEAINIYRGNAACDARGNALVQLPDYFEALNRDFHYQLTPIGAPALLFVAREIENNTFAIGGGQPGMRVSWTVTGVRNDPYARTYGKSVEQEKTAEERGRYIFPELYGKPESAALRPRPAAR